MCCCWWTYFPLVGGQVAQDVRAQGFLAQAPAAQTAPHLAVLIRHDVVPVPAHQGAAHQVGQLQIGEDVLQDAGWQPGGHAGASSGRGSVGGAGGATTGRRCCCARAGGASSSSSSAGRCGHRTPALHRRHQATEQFHFTVQEEP